MLEELKFLTDFELNKLRKIPRVMGGGGGSVMLYSLAVLKRKGSERELQPCLFMARSRTSY